MLPTDPKDLHRYRRYFQTIESALTKRSTRTYASVIFSFLAVSLFGLYAMLPTVRTILFLRREISDKTKVSIQMEEKITALIEAQAVLEAAGDKLNLLNEAIPIVAQPVELATTIRNLAQQTGASVSAIQISDVPLAAAEATGSAQPPTKLSSYPVNTVLTGQYSTLKAFLDGAVNLRRLIDIETISFTPATQAIGVPTGSVGLQLVLKLKTYWQNF